MIVTATCDNDRQVIAGVIGCVTKVASQDHSRIIEKCFVSLFDRIQIDKELIKLLNDTLFYARQALQSFGPASVM